MTSKIEIRVRAVQRHLVTEWQERSGSRVIGEFESSSVADEVAWALQAKMPGATVVTSDGAVSPGKPHTSYPSRYAIGEKVLRKACDVRVVGGMLRPYAAEPAEVTSVHFYPGKVCYQVIFPSGRGVEVVDSVELEDLS